MVGKLSIPKADEEFDEVSDLEKKMSRSIELNEIAYTELILSIDVKTSSGKIAFGIVKDVKVKIIQTVMQQVLGRSSRTSLNLCLPLLWLS